MAQAYLTSQDGFSFNWIPGGAVSVNQAVAETPRYALLNIEWSYQLDPLSAIFMLIVTGVGLCIFVFATGYMHGEAGFYRFFAYMGLFMFAMLVLVMGSNFLMMFVGWEGVGLCSYLLIGYYFDRQEAANASRKAFITNRVGDFGFALAIFGIIATFGSAQYTEVFEQAKSFPVELLGHWGILSWIALGLFVGACGKSAQLPLHVWLPDAMAGPTPVSALIHAATMVTAGLYMVTRTNVIFQHSQTMLLVVALVGAATAIFAATIGITQNDIKKVLAYSTVSQLGFMFMACGVGAFVIAIFHVMTHAFFKALMFLGAGSVIHGMHHEQDMRRMGGLKKYMPYTYWTFYGRVACDLRHHSVQRLLVQRRNPLECSFDNAHSAWLARLADRHYRRDLHRVLHDAPDGDDVLGQRTISRRCWWRGRRSARFRLRQRPGAARCYPFLSRRSPATRCRVNMLDQYTKTSRTT